MRKKLLKSAIVFCIATTISTMVYAQDMYKAPLAKDVITTADLISSSSDDMVFPTTEWQAYADTSWYYDSVNEFTLTTEEQLAGLSKLVKEGNTFAGKTIILGNDLDLGAHRWMAIGYNHKTPFSGNFYGNNHTIRNLKVYRGDLGDFLGLFGYYSSGHLKDLIVDGAMIKGKDTSGVIAGNFTLNSKMENCHVKNAKVLAIFNPKYTSSAYNVGILCGSLTSSSIVDNCSAEGSIEGFQQVGGLVGSPWNRAVIKNSHFKGKVKGSYYVGGLAGFSTFGFGPKTEIIIEDCYAIAEVKGDEHVGGFFGGLQVGMIRNAYSASTVIGKSETIGGFVGSVGGGGIIENAHYDNTLAPFSELGFSSSNNVSILAHQTEEMKQVAFLNLLNANRTPKIWKFENGVNNNYPIIDYTKTMSVADTKPLVTVSIYPTLAKDKIYLSDKAQVYDYEVIDFTGKLIKYGKIKDFINVEGLAKGVYLLKLKNKQGYTVQKFIKN